MSFFEWNCGLFRVLDRFSVKEKKKRKEIIFEWST